MTKELVIKWKKSRTDLDEVNSDLEEQAKVLEAKTDNLLNEEKENLSLKKEEKRTYHKYKRETIYKDQLRELSIDAKYELVAESVKDIEIEKKENEKDTEESLDTEESESSNRLKRKSDLFIVRV
jgi:hypothetical protein